MGKGGQLGGEDGDQTCSGEQAVGHTQAQLFFKVLNIYIYTHTNTHTLTLIYFKSIIS